MQGRNRETIVWERATRAATLGLLILLLAYTAWYLLHYSDFSNDDLDNLVLMRHTGFWQFVLTPTDVHYVPLHRLLTWAAYHIDPMAFGVPVAIMLAVQTGTIIYLVASLKLLGVKDARGLLVCAYAASGLLIYGLSWWAHAEHRAPYVFLDVCAVYHYLAWLRKERGYHLCVAALAFVLAFGFYEKAVFIPLHMLVIGYLGYEARFRAQPIRAAWPTLLLAVGSAAYVLAYLFLHPASAQSTLTQALSGDIEYVKVLFAAATGLGVEAARDIPVHGWSVQLAVLLVTGLIALAWCLWRRRGGWKVLMLLLFVLMLDYMPIAMSNRIPAFGLMAAHEYRFGYEELQLVLLFFGILWARTAVTPATAAGRKLGWLAGFFLVLLLAGLNASDVRESRHSSWSSLWMMDHSHSYLANLRQGLSMVSTAEPIFENDPVPLYLSVFKITSDTRTLLPLFMPAVRFDDRMEPHYKVLQSGRIVYNQ